MLILLLLSLIFALIIQYFIECICNAVYKAKISKNLDNISSIEDFVFMSYRDFVYLTAEIFRRKGFNVAITDKCGEEGNGLIIDNAVFAEVWKNGLKHVMDVETGMKLAKCMQTNSIYRGILITLGDFKPTTLKYCHKNVIQCINGKQLFEMCREVQRNLRLQQVQ